MAISLSQHRKVISQTVIGRFSDDRAPLQGLSAFFPSVTTVDKAVSIEVERNRQLLAVDVQRCTDPNRNTFNKSTEKIFIPPFYSESFDFTSCQRYDATYGQGAIPQIADSKRLVMDSSKKILALKYKILRAIEKQRSDVLQTGIVTLKNGDSIDFKRKAASMVTKTGTDQWNAFATANPLGNIETGADFLKKEGLSTLTEINAVLGQTAMSNFLQNPAVQKERAIFSNFRSVDIGMPILNSLTGLIWRGRVAAGNYIVNLWTYSDFYELPNGTKVDYIDTNACILIPSDFEGVTAHAGIPAVLGSADDLYVSNVEGEFVVHDVIDQVKKAWDFIIESAPIVVPISIDRIYTINTVTV